MAVNVFSSGLDAVVKRLAEIDARNDALAREARLAEDTDLQRQALEQSRKDALEQRQSEAEALRDYRQQDQMLKAEAIRQKDLETQAKRAEAEAKKAEAAEAKAKRAEAYARFSSAKTDDEWRAALQFAQESGLTPAQIGTFQSERAFRSTRDARDRTANRIEAGGGTKGPKDNPKLPKGLQQSLAQHSVNMSREELQQAFTEQMTEQMELHPNLDPMLVSRYIDGLYRNVGSKDPTKKEEPRFKRVMPAAPNPAQAGGAPAPAEKPKVAGFVIEEIK